MKKSIYFLSILFLAVIFFNTGCSNDNPESKKIIEEKVQTGNENETLIKFLEQSGNFINNKRIPTLISAENVRANLKNYFIIDIRRHGDYVNGHINGAVNIDHDDLISYLNNNVAAGVYDKIVIVCYSGHKSGYSAMMLQLLGYSNVYSLKWGMSAWEKNTAEKKWVKHISDKYVSNLELTNNQKLPKTQLPEIYTGKTLGYDILEARADTLLKQYKFTIGINEVMENPDNYYIINYWPEYNYKKGHLPGAVQYNPKLSLVKDADLLTLPADKKIVVYDYTGQHACFVVAYLQVLGYDAYALTFGANSFMYSKLTSLKIGHAFNKNEVKNYPVVQGELPSVKTVGTATDNIEEDNSPVTILKKKVKKEEEGGC